MEEGFIKMLRVKEKAIKILMFLPKNHKLDLMDQQTTSHHVNRFFIENLLTKFLFSLLLCHLSPCVFYSLENFLDLKRKEKKIFFQPCLLVDIYMIKQRSKQTAHFAPERFAKKNTRLSVFIVVYRHSEEICVYFDSKGEKITTKIEEEHTKLRVCWKTDFYFIFLYLSKNIFVIVE